MKKCTALLLALALISCFGPALADVDEWVIFETGIGFTALYPDFLLRAYSEPSAETGLETVYFLPLDENDPARMWCRQTDDPDEPDWEARGYQRIEGAEPAFDLYVNWDIRFALYLSPDGEEVVEEVRLEVPDGTEEFPSGYEYVFDLRYPVDDPEYWQDIFEGILEMIEFPAQPAEAGSFRLDFFQGGAVGMQFIDVVVDEEAGEIVLTPLNAVTDFALERVIWDEETFEIAGAEPVYTADSLTPENHLKITCWFSDVLPDLRVRCLNEEGDAECWYLLQSGYDGSLLLLSEEEVLF